MMIVNSQLVFVSVLITWYICPENEQNKQWLKYVLFYPIFRTTLSFYIRVLKTVAFANWLAAI